MSTISPNTLAFGGVCILRKCKTQFISKTGVFATVQTTLLSVLRTCECFIIKQLQSPQLEKTIQPIAYNYSAIAFYKTQGFKI
ncbi:MAG: hypothetical protein AB8B65_03470 [Kordia sp.]|uniref:hypothetical protein n=1 Tax=Kordia sp. TaxID=1965332 RepID=UPI00385A9DB7